MSTNRLARGTSTPAEHSYRLVDAPEVRRVRPVAAGTASARQAAYGPGEGRASYPPPPPQRLAQAQGPVITAIASPIAETVLKLIVDSAADDITYSVPKLEGLKHVNDDKANRGASVATATLDLQMPREYMGEWPFPTREIYVDFRVTFQYDGRSLGNIFIQRTKAVDAAGWGLDAKCELLNDAGEYIKPGTSGPSFAAIRLLFTSTFDAPWPFDDSIALTTVMLYGNGSSTVRHEWTQR